MINSSQFNMLSEQLHSAVISDILDDLGYRDQVLDPGIRPLLSTILVGRAFPVLAADVYEIPDEPYKLQLEALDSIQENDIFIVQTGSVRAAFWGELISSSTRARGGRGAIIDGLSRDTKQIIEMQFPVFSRGYYPVDSKGRIDVIQYNVPIECGGVQVFPGDLIFGDVDGVVIVPQKIEDEAIRLSLEKVRDENTVREALNGGMKASEAYNKFGVL
jgi:4-hydroxy-4-methyl-2-oxoglutarate aldolase